MRMEDLEEIVGKVAARLAEKWAIESDLTTESPAEVIADAVEVTAFVINSFFEYYNVMMSLRSLQV